MDIITYALCKNLIKTSIEELGDIFTLKGNVASVNQLPSTGNQPGDIYFVGPNEYGSYDEYYWTSGNTWEIMGSTGPGFDGIITEEIMYKGQDGTGTLEEPAEDTILYEVNNAIDTKQDNLTPGNNISIVNNTISAVDTTYESKNAASGGSDVSLVTTGEKYTWNNKGTYSKPNGGIPKSDLTSAVQASLDLADSALQSFTEVDPTVPAHVKAITSQDITNWNAKSEFSGSYDDLTDKPSIPSKTSDLTNDSDFAIDASYVHTDNNFTTEEKLKLNAIASGAEVNKIDSIKVNGTTQTISNKSVNIIVPTDISDLTNDSGYITNTVNNLTNYTLATDTGSTIELDINSSTYVVTLNLKNAAGTTISTDTIDLPLESVVVNGSYDETNKKVILTLQNGNTVEFSIADLIDGLQNEITSNNKLSADLVDDTSTTNKFVTSNDITNWNAKSEFSGNYNDLTNKPSIPTATSDLTNDSNFVSDNSYVHTDNNYTSTDKNKLNNIELGAQENVIESIKVNGVTQTITNKAVDIAVPTNVSDLNNDSDFPTDANYIHTDNNFTTELKTKLENIAENAEVNKINTIKVNDITQTIKNKTVNITIPTNVSDLNNDSSFIDASVNNLENYTLTSESVGKIDLSINTTTYVMTASLYDNSNTLVSSDTIDLPLESVVVNGSYNSSTKKVILTLQNGNTIEFSVADLISGLQTEITNNNKLSSDLIDDTNSTNKFVTASDISNWNNKGTYSQPSGGIPKSDLASGVQNSLDLADTALQSYTETDPTVPSHVKAITTTNISNWNNKGTYSKPSGGIPKTDLASAVQASLGKADTALQSETYTGTITGITMNGTSKGTSGIVDLGTVITSHQDISGKVNKSGDTMTGALTTTELTIGTRGNGSIGTNSVAEGYYTVASGTYSHAEGSNSSAQGNMAHAEGFATVTISKSQHAQGEYNIQDNTGTASTRGTYAHIVGNGTDGNNRSNAHTLTWMGEAWYAGDVYVGSTSGTNKDAGSKKLATENYVTLAISNAIGGVSSFQYQVVQSLPAMGQTGIIYLLPQSGGSSQNTYDEYIWTSSAYELIGSTELNLAEYVKIEDLESISESEIVAAFA